MHPGPRPGPHSLLTISMKPARRGSQTLALFSSAATLIPSITPSYPRLLNTLWVRACELSLLSLNTHLHSTEIQVHSLRSHIPNQTFPRVPFLWNSSSILLVNQPGILQPALIPLLLIYGRNPFASTFNIDPTSDHLSHFCSLPWPWQLSAPLLPSVYSLHSSLQLPDGSYLTQVKVRILPVASDVASHLPWGFMSNSDPLVFSLPSLSAVPQKHQGHWTFCTQISHHLLESLLEYHSVRSSHRLFKKLLHPSHTHCLYPHSSFLSPHSTGHHLLC